MSDTIVEEKSLNALNANATESESSLVNEEHDVAIIIPVKHKTLCNLEQQRHDTELCDVILQVEDKEFPAHKTVLAASSVYFLKMFTVEMKEKYSKKIPIKTVTATAMSEILKSIYTQAISFSMENISDILHGASLMQFSSVANAAVSYIEQTIQIENCFWFRDLVLSHPFENLKEVVRCFFLAHIEEAATMPEFLHFTFSELDSLFSSDDLQIKKEQTVFEMIIKWVNKDLDERKEDFPRLFKHVRLQFVPIDYLIDFVGKNGLVVFFDNCRPIIEAAYQFHIRPSSQVAQKPRKCYMYVADRIMHISWSGLQSVFDFKSKSWKSISQCPYLLNKDYCVVACKPPITVVCGVGESKKEAIRFDGYRWTELPSMNEVWIGSAAVFCDDEVFVFGGEKKSGFTHSMFHNYKDSFYYSYETFSGAWQLNFSIELNQRSYFAAQAVGNKIYLIGGYRFFETTRNNYEKIPCTETRIFCPSKNTWKIAGSLWTARASFSSAVLNSKIYVFGGIGAGRSSVNSVEIFDVGQKCWTSGGTIQQAISCPMSACSVSNTIYFSKEQQLYKYRKSVYAGGKSDLEVDRNAPGGGILLPFSHRYLSYHLFKFCTN